jgi:G3E family GTPase
VTGTLPAIVLGGYLGAGKTTLLNRLLRNAGGRRIAVMVNDFGEVGIDADLVESRDGDVMNLAGGCVCCSVGSDLIGALVALPQRTPPPDLVLIEASGVALPGAIARSVRLAPGIEVDGVVVLADAETVRARASDRYVGDTVQQQLRDADLLVLNKLDLLDDDEARAVQAWLAGVAPRARIVPAIEADVPPELVLGLAEGEHPVQSLARRGDGLFAGDPSARRLAGRRRTAAADVFDSTSLAVPDPVDADALSRALADPASGVVRAKGVVRDLAGSWTVIQTVGARARCAPVDPGTAAGRDAGSGRLVAIGVRGSFDPRAVAALLCRRDR